MAGLDADLFIFKEKVDKEIIDILAKLSQSDKLIKKQEEEIRNLKTENLKIKSRLQTLACIANDSSPTRNVMSNANVNNQQSYAEKTINSMTMPTDCAVNANCSSVKNPNTFLRDKKAGSNHAKQNKPEASRSNQIYLCENQGDNDIQSDQSKLHNSNNTIPDVVEVDNMISTNDNSHTQSQKNNSKSNKDDEVVSIEIAASVDASTLESDGFIGVKRKRNNVKKIFLCGIADTVTAETILNYLQKRNIRPTHLRTFSSQRKGTISAKLNVLASDSSVVVEVPFDPDFWGGAGRRGAAHHYICKGRRIIIYARGGASLYMQGAAHHYICKGRRIIIYAGN